MSESSLFQFPLVDDELNLYRYPRRPRETLRAWDAADEYLLSEFQSQNLDPLNTTVLVANDQCGALALVLRDYKPASWSDSHLSRLASQANCETNEVNPSELDFLPSTQSPPVDQIFDAVLIKVPKTLALLEHQLSVIRRHCKPDTLVIAAGMVKHIHKSTLALFEKHLGPCTTSLARKKARLIFTQIDMDRAPVGSSSSASYTLENTQFEIHNHANVFSRESLDIGTRFFLAHLPCSEHYETIVDLGCGNGVVGLIASDMNPSAKLLFKDESYMAVDSAERNFRAAFGPEREAEFEAADCLGEISAESVDLILNNPPFHQQNVVGEFVAWQMFQESLAALKKDGELWVVANRHLNYQNKLKRLFGNCSQVASNKKFVILKATKRR